MQHSAAFTPQGQAFASTSSPGASQRGGSGEGTTSNLRSLAAIWARKYFVSVTSQYDVEQTQRSEQFADADSPEGRKYTTEKLQNSLQLASAQAWSQTEALLSQEVQRHGIDRRLLDPWKIAADSHGLFDKALKAYGDRLTARRLSVVIGDDCGRVRQHYTEDDPRAIGFVSMQFHYTGKILLDQLSPSEQMLFAPYIKVMDDHLYMPLRDAYFAAANHEIDSPQLKAVQHLLPISTKIAHRVCKQIMRLHPTYESLNGSLASDLVKTSSIRDVEMFQVYLCPCVLEGNIRSVQRQLFPLCVMLYPRLKVSWQLVQDMLQVIGWELFELMPPDDMSVLIPYLRTLTDMFSHEVFSY